MTDWRQAFDEAMLRIVGYTLLDNRLPKEYLPGVSLLPREMHTLEAILNHPGINTTQLSRLTGTPKGTISKMTRALQARGLLELFRQPGNQKEVHYQGTLLGKQVFQAHIHFHQTHGKAFYEHFQALQEDQKALVVQVLCQYADYMKEYCDHSSPIHQNLKGGNQET